MAVSKALAALPQAHYFVIVQNRLVDARKLQPADIAAVRTAESAGEVVCPTCSGPMRVIVSDGAFAAEHTGPNPFADHEPEDQEVRMTKHLIQERLQELFPSAAVSLDVHFPEANLLADIALVTPTGGKVIVEVQSKELTREEVKARIAAYESNGIACLWVIDHRRLTLPKKGGMLRKVTLNKLETSLLGTSQPLLYVNPRTREVTYVKPPAAIRELAHLGDPRIGRVDCIVRTERVGQLRMTDGIWALEHFGYTPKAPPPAQLPENLAKRLAKRQAAATP